LIFIYCLIAIQFSDNPYAIQLSLMKLDVDEKPVGKVLRRARTHTHTDGRTTRKHMLPAAHGMSGGGIKSTSLLK